MENRENRKRNRRKTAKRLFAAFAAAGLFSSGMTAYAGEADQMETSLLESDAKEEEREAAVIAGNNQNAAKLLAALYQKEDTVFISPYSISAVLSMLSAAVSETDEPVKAELLAWLGLNKDITDEELAAAHRSILDELDKEWYIDSLKEQYAWEQEFSGMEEAQETEDLTGDAEEETVSGMMTDASGDAVIPDACFRSANALLVSNTLPVSDTFEELADILSAYNAEAEFVTIDSEQTKDEINSWCSEHTSGMIPQLLSEPLPADAAAVLMNAVYFYGQWADPFEEEMTSEMTFHGTDGDVSADMMYLKENGLEYAEDDSWQYLRLHYNNGFTMNLYLPREGTDPDFSDADMMAELFSADREYSYDYEVTVRLPKFETEFSAKLNNVLSALGLSAVFDGAVYDRLTAEPLKIGEVLHKAKISVDEIGTEAAAVTAVVMEMMAFEPEEPKVREFIADHPFVYTITEDGTGLIAFEGILSNIQ